MGSAMAGLVNAASGWLNSGFQPSPAGNRHPSIAPYQTYRAADGSFALATGNQAHWHRLCDVLDLPGVADDPRFATNADRVSNVDALEEVLEASLAKATVASWIDALRAQGIPAGPINDLAGAFATAESVDLEVVSDFEGVRSVASPMKFSATPPTVRRRPPGLDEHRAEILTWLGDGNRQATGSA